MVIFKMWTVPIVLIDRSYHFLAQNNFSSCQLHPYFIYKCDTFGNMFHLRQPYLRGGLIIVSFFAFSRFLFGLVIFNKGWLKTALGG